MTSPLRLLAFVFGAIVNASTFAAPESAALEHRDMPATSTATAATPDFGPNVLIFDPSMSAETIQTRVSDVFGQQEAAQFGDGRFALLFKPGQYDVDVRVGFYTQVAGLGQMPDDVQLNGGLRVTAEWMRGNATCNFWRSAENLSSKPPAGKPMMWATSQAVSLRRVHVRGDLHLWDGGWSSGGFLADSIIDGTVVSGSQQQWISRNTKWNKWDGGNWNMVFVGVTNPPAGEWPAKPYTVIEHTPIVREKPFLAVDASGRFVVIVPELRREASIGPGWDEPSRTLPIDAFFIAKPEHDAPTINAALAGGKHLLFTPGHYALSEPIRVNRPGTIVMGMGYATLMPTNGTPAMLIADVDGVTIASLLFESVERECDVLLQVGEPGSSASHKANPTFLFDVFCRAGGAIAGRAKCFLTIHSNDVVADNLWLWRADHGKGAEWDVNRNANGLIVNGKDVTVYGLFVEHCQKYQTIWNGDGGRVYFYQSEMPYDPPDAASWRSPNGKTGYASYKVADHVTSHEAWGLGVYCVFRGGPVIADSAIEAPERPGVSLRHLIAVRLSGLENSGIRRVINDRGASVITDHKSIVD